MANEELIMHAREFLATPNLGRDMARELDKALAYIRELADIAEAAEARIAELEAATRVPVQGEGYTVEIDGQHFTQAQWEAVQRYCEGSQAVQGEPNDDREAMSMEAQEWVGNE